MRCLFSASHGDLCGEVSKGGAVGGAGTPADLASGRSARWEGIGYRAGRHGQDIIREAAHDGGVQGVATPRPPDKGIRLVGERRTHQGLARGQDTRFV